MRITLQQIEALVWAARLGGIHAAARHLHLTQPAISARLRELETALGITLFDRSKSRIELTAAGRQALLHAERLLAKAMDMESQCKADPLEGLLRLGADESSAMAGLAGILALLRQAYPCLQVEVTIDNGVVLEQKLRAHEIDLAMCGLLETLDESVIVSELIGWVDFQWVAPIAMAIPECAFTPGVAASLPIITRPPASISHKMVRRWLVSRGQDLEGYSACNSLALTLMLVEAGYGIALLPKTAFSQSLAAGKVKSLLPEPAMAPAAFGLHYRRSLHSAYLLDILRIIQRTLHSAGYFTPDELPVLA